MTKVLANKIQTLTGHTDCVYALARADQDHLFFSAGGDGMVVRWDLQKEQSGELISKLSNSIYALHYLRDRDLLIVGHNYDCIHVLDLQNRKELRSMKIGEAAIFDINSIGNDLL